MEEGGWILSKEGYTAKSSKSLLVVKVCGYSSAVLVCEAGAIFLVRIFGAKGGCTGEIVSFVCRR